MATRFHAAEPVSQEFFASPGVAAAFPAIICAYTYGSQPWSSDRSSRADGLILRYVSNARSALSIIVSAIAIHGFVWLKTAPFSLYPGG
jgi:hypothetical protein